LLEQIDVRGSTAAAVGRRGGGLDGAGEWDATEIWRAGCDGDRAAGERDATEIGRTTAIAEGVRASAATVAGGALANRAGEEAQARRR
jgi:hypothetical protein